MGSNIPKIGTSDIVGCYVGDTEIEKVYLGSDIIYEKQGGGSSDVLHLVNCKVDNNTLVNNTPYSTSDMDWANGQYTQMAQCYITNYPTPLHAYCEYELGQVVKLYSHNTATYEVIGFICNDREGDTHFGKVPILGRCRNDYYSTTRHNISMLSNISEYNRLETDIRISSPDLTNIYSTTTSTYTMYCRIIKDGSNRYVVQYLFLNSSGGKIAQGSYTLGTNQSSLLEAKMKYIAFLIYSVSYAELDNCFCSKETDVELTLDNLPLLTNKVSFDNIIVDT